MLLTCSILLVYSPMLCYVATSFFKGKHTWVEVVFFALGSSDLKKCSFSEKKCIQLSEHPVAVVSFLLQPSMLLVSPEMDKLVWTLLMTQLSGKSFCVTATQVI